MQLSKVLSEGDWGHVLNNPPPDEWIEVAIEYSSCGGYGRFVELKVGFFDGDRFVLYGETEGLINCGCGQRAFFPEHYLIRSKRFRRTGHLPCDIYPDNFYQINYYRIIRRDDK